MKDLNDAIINSNVERLKKLLEEREYDFKVMVNNNDPNDWVVQFISDRNIPGESIFHFITPKTKIVDLWWLT